MHVKQECLSNELGSLTIMGSWANNTIERLQPSCIHLGSTQTGLLHILHSSERRYLIQTLVSNHVECCIIINTLRQSMQALITTLALITVDPLLAGIMLFELHKEFNTLRILKLSAQL